MTRQVMDPSLLEMPLYFLPPELQEMVVSLLPLASRAGNFQFLQTNLNLKRYSSSLGGVPGLARLSLHLPPLLERLHNPAAQRLARPWMARSCLPAAVIWGTHSISNNDAHPNNYQMVKKVLDPNETSHESHTCSMAPPCRGKSALQVSFLNLITMNKI